MRNLVKQIAERTNLPEEKAKEVLSAISMQIKEDFPLLSSMMELMLNDKNFQKKKSVIIDLPANKFNYN